MKTMMVILDDKSIHFRRKIVVDFVKKTGLDSNDDTLMMILIVVVGIVFRRSKYFVS